MRRPSDLNMGLISFLVRSSTILDPFFWLQEGGRHAGKEGGTPRLRREVGDRRHAQRELALSGDRPKARGVAHDGVERGEAQQGVLQAQGDAESNSSQASQQRFMPQRLQVQAAAWEEHAGQSATLSQSRYFEQRDCAFACA